MRKISLLTLVLFGALFTVSGLSARTVYIHGYQAWLIGDPIKAYNCQDQKTCSYWSGQDTAPDAVNVGWLASEAWPYFGVPRAMAILDKYCRGSSCEIVCHSTGCPITGYILDNYGSRYLISAVHAQGSAEGGTDMAEVGKLFGFISGTGVYFLGESVVRGYYDHNDTAGKTIYETAGTKGNLLSIILKGEDDGVVPEHSACGYNRIFNANKCNGDWYYCPVWYNPFRTCTAGKFNNRKAREYYIDHSGTTKRGYQSAF